MTNKLTPGTLVWAYNAPVLREGLIEREFESPAEAYHVRTSEGCRLYCRFHIFRRPEELDKCIAELRDDADMLERQARELELRPGDG